MKPLKIALTALIMSLVAYSASASNMPDIPDYDRTYTNSDQKRGTSSKNDFVFLARLVGQPSGNLVVSKRIYFGENHIN